MFILKLSDIHKGMFRIISMGSLIRLQLYGFGLFPYLHKATSKLEQSINWKKFFLDTNFHLFSFESILKIILVKLALDYSPYMFNKIVPEKIGGLQYLRA